MALFLFLIPIDLPDVVKTNKQSKIKTNILTLQIATWITGIIVQRIQGHQSNPIGLSGSQSSTLTKKIQNVCFYVMHLKCKKYIFILVKGPQK